MESVWRQKLDKSLAEEALAEFYEADEDGRHKLVYAYFGLAVYIGQCLEEMFSFMLRAHKIVDKEKPIDEIFDSNDREKKTFGNYVNEIKQVYEISDEVYEDLKSVLQKRNYLIHRYFKDKISKFYSTLGQEEMILDFCHFIDQSERLEDNLKNYLTEYHKRLGITPEKLEVLLEQMREEEINREQYIKDNFR